MSSGQFKPITRLNRASARRTRPSAKYASARPNEASRNLLFGPILLYPIRAIQGSRRDRILLKLLVDSRLHHQRPAALLVQTCTLRAKLGATVVHQSVSES